MLLVHGANVNAAETWMGETALMWAAAEDHAAMVKLLLEPGADAQRPRRPHRVPEDRLQRQHDGVDAAAAGRHDGADAGGAAGRCPGALALSEAGADLNLTDPDGTSALVMAIVNRHNDVAAAAPRERRRSERGRRASAWPRCTPRWTCAARVADQPADAEGGRRDRQPDAGVDAPRARAPTRTRASGRRSCRASTTPATRSWPRARRR